MTGHRIERGERIGLALILAGYVLGGLFLLNPYLGNADLVSYISIAQHWLRGDLHSAVNSYWSPLFSLLLVPLLALGIEPIIAAKLLSHASGILFLLGAHRLTFLADLTPQLRLTVQLVLAPFILICYAFISITPDILMAGILFFYLACLFHQGYPERRSLGVMAGLFGGLAFLAKHYAFAFFLAHFLLFNLVLLRSAASGRERRRAAATAILGLAVFLAVSSPYIAAISLRSGRLMINTSATVNWRLFGIKTIGHAHDYQGFIPPAGPTAVSDWENPEPGRLPGWSPVESWKAFWHFLTRLKIHLLRFLQAVWNFSWLAWPILAAATAFALSRGPRHRFLRRSWWAAAIYASGLILILPLDRYLLPTLALVVIMGAVLAARLFGHRAFSGKPVRAAVLGVFLAGFLYPCAPFLMRHVKRSELFFIDEYKNTDVRIHALGKWVERHVIPPPGSRYASNLCWQATMYLAYYTKAQYYGIMNVNLPPESLQRELERNKIDYFFLWFEPTELYPFLSSRRDLTRGKFDDLRIYRIRDP